MNHNKKGQSYVIDGRFRLTETEGVVEYCRVRFLQTGSTQVFPHKIVETGEFEDLSLVKVLKAESPSQADIASLKEFMKEDSMFAILPANSEPSITTSLVHKGEPSKPVTLGIRNASIVQRQVVAISPKGKKIKVTDLKEFCETYKLDLGAVRAVLEGEQKTHKRWRFTTV